MISPRLATWQNEASGRARRRQRLNTVPKNDSRVFPSRGGSGLSQILNPSRPIAASQTDALRNKVQTVALWVPPGPNRAR